MTPRWEREAFHFLRYACGLAAVLSTVAAAAAWAVGNNPWGYCLIAALNLAGVRAAAAQVRRIDRDAVLAMPEVQAMLAALRGLNENVGGALRPPMGAMADTIAAFNKAMQSTGTALSEFAALGRSLRPGTVQNPSDPSPRPRP